MPRLTYPEMKKAYPDEWVLIDDIVEDDSLEIVSGVVIAHSPKRVRLQKTILQKPRNWQAIRYTGRIKGNFVLVLS